MCPVPYEGVVWKSAEHAYQAAKTNSQEWKDKIAAVNNPAEAKRLGKQVPMKVF